MHKLFATFFGLGYFSFASGSVGSAGAALLVWFILPTKSPWYVLGTVLAIPVAGVLCGGGERLFGKTDAKQIVLDEAVGTAITYIGMPKDWRLFALGFFLFRLYDVVKIPPAGAAERLGGGWGVLLDDVVSGVYANIGLWIARYLLRI